MAALTSHKLHETKDLGVYFEYMVKKRAFWPMNFAPVTYKAILNLPFVHLVEIHTWVIFLNTRQGQQFLMVYTAVTECHVKHH